MNSGSFQDKDLDKSQIDKAVAKNVWITKHSQISYPYVTYEVTSQLLGFFIDWCLCLWGKVYSLNQCHILQPVSRWVLYK